jgi:hypothetical protein
MILYKERDSGWALSAIVNLMININVYTLLLASSYIDLPEQIKVKRACINVKNKDDACFAWAVTSALHPTNDHAERCSSYPHYSNILNLDGIKFPMNREQIHKFEIQNNLSINIYAAC